MLLRFCRFSFSFLSSLPQCSFNLSLIFILLHSLFLPHFLFPFLVLSYLLTVISIELIRRLLSESSKNIVCLEEILMYLKESLDDFDPVLHSTDQIKVEIYSILQIEALYKNMVGGGVRGDMCEYTHLLHTCTYMHTTCTCINSGMHVGCACARSEEERQWRTART